MDCSDLAPLLPGAAYAGELHSFIFAAPSECVSVAVTALRFLWKFAAGVTSAAVSGVLAVLGSLFTAVIGILASNATHLLLGTVLVVAWQIYYPFKVLIAMLAKSPYCQGVIFDLCPAANDEDILSEKKYVALTIDDGPCPYHTEPVLDVLDQHSAKATFFVIGAHVDQCDVWGAGDGRFEAGRTILRRMAAEGHELGNHTWHDRPSYKLSPSQLRKELADAHKLIKSAQEEAAAADAPAEASDDDLSLISFAHTTSNSLNDFGASSSSSNLQHANQTGRRYRWFRPGSGWFMPEMVEAAQQLGYRTVLGSVFPWDTHSKWPLLNALFIITKVYCGAIIVLHDRRQHLLPTLQYVLPWLDWWGYEVVTLGEAATRAAGGSRQALTSDVLQSLIAQDDPSLLAVDRGGGASVVEGTLMNPDKLKVSGSYLAQMTKERERAALMAAAEEEERQRLRAAKAAEADRRAGIDRRLAGMSAAEKRAIERREREKKEAERRKARKKAEAIRAKERYEEYIRQRAQEEIERREAEKVEAVKAKEAEERRRLAEEDFKRRQDAQRAAAAEMVARMKAEQEAAAMRGSIAAETSEVLEITAASSTAGDSVAADSLVGSTKNQGRLSFLKKLGRKVRPEATEGRQMALARLDAALAAQTSTITAAMLKAAAAHPAAAETDDSDAPGGPGAAVQPAAVPTAAAAAAALAAVESSLPAPVVGDYARGPTGKVLLGFTSEPLLMAEGPDGQPVILDSQGNALTGPDGEQMVLLLGSQGTPLVDPHGRPVFVAVDSCTGSRLGVHPDGSIITVPAATAAVVLAAAVAHTPADGSADLLTAAAGPDLGADAISNVKVPDSYAPSASCSISMESGQSAATTPSAAAAPAEATDQLPSASQQHPKHLSTPALQATEHTGVDAAGGALPARVPATLLLGPHGKPLLGVDNRPLIVAVDEEGVPLALNPEGGLLLGPDDRPLQLAFASDGSLVALDSYCRPLSGPDGKPRVVALDRQGRPFTDDSGRPVLLTLGPNGLPLPDSAAPSARVSWAGSAAGTRVSHSGAPGGLAAFGSGNAGLEVMVGMDDGAEMVVDAADYGEYSAAPAGAASADPLIKPVAEGEDCASGGLLKQQCNQVQAHYSQDLQQDQPDQQQYGLQHTIDAAPAPTAGTSADVTDALDDQAQHRQLLVQHPQQEAAPANVLLHRCSDWTDEISATPVATPGPGLACSDHSNQSALSTPSPSGAASAAACGKLHHELTHGFSVTATASSQIH
eukprot:gene11358-11507_t